MSLNANQERRKSRKSQQKALTELNQDFNHAPAATNRTPATSSGVRQVTSLVKLPTIDKTITLKDGEVELRWRLKCDDFRALQMMLLIYEANQWTVNHA